MARTKGHGNPKWSRDETILALDLYFRCDGNMPVHHDTRVQELSNLLRSLPFHVAASRKESFRNLDSVTFKLQNLRKVATGKGLGNVSGMDRRVWADFGSYPNKVKELSELIRKGMKLPELLTSTYSEDIDVEFFEGRVLTEIHKRRERDPNVRKHLLASRRKTGRLTCDMCYGGPYSPGPVFEDSIFETHHLVPMSMTLERKTRLKDVALLCANCHRFLHRAISIEKRWLNLAEGRQISGLLNSRRGKLQ